MSQQLINETVAELDLNINVGLLLKLTLIATYQIGSAPLYFKTITAIERLEERRVGGRVSAPFVSWWCVAGFTVTTVCICVCVCDCDKENKRKTRFLCQKNP